ncbi:putative BYS1 domain protein [Delitschia confertaspora ATCC 74209]|uniref:BYS1 domain protein n=1 Tax=Delitschia confertaspora ATCC 74209 TaxID=1513339 RepID=A0A9P4MVZ1_9PLEO|nr:putative BYS1 domain protein [Delitschia confertaspora ATCC 74209]
MHFPSTAAALALLLTLTNTVSAYGNATVLNHCPFPTYLWSVASTASPQHNLSSTTGSYMEPLHTDPKTGGIAIKITTVANGLVSNAPQLNFAYALNEREGSVYYDLSSVFGDPFAGSKVEIKPKEGCAKITWEKGTRPEGSGTQACFDTAADLVLTLC